MTTCGLYDLLLHHDVVIFNDDVNVERDILLNEELERQTTCCCDVAHDERG